jgi:predicted kinase
MKTKELLILVGISGSGKSTYSNSRMNDDCIRINRDSLRTSLFISLDEYYSKDSMYKKELEINSISNLILENSIFSFNTIIIDNTNLNLSYINNNIDWFSKSCDRNGFDYEIKFKFFDCNLDVAKRRVVERDFKNEENKEKRKELVKYIEKQHSIYTNVKRSIYELYKDDTTGKINILNN